ncbi:hypothetical protein TNCV_564551 [Trichonephila clavipes]|nr:hypothetical protein TNCV_564551 [Trichonephila clavipes]
MGRFIIKTHPSLTRSDALLSCGSSPSGENDILRFLTLWEDRDVSGREMGFTTSFDSEREGEERNLFQSNLARVH